MYIGYTGWSISGIKSNISYTKKKEYVSLATVLFAIKAIDVLFAIGTKYFQHLGVTCDQLVF